MQIIQTIFWSVFQFVRLIYCVLPPLPVFFFNRILFTNFSGVHESEIRTDEEFRSKLTCDGGYLNDVPSDIGNLTSFGAVSYVEMKRLNSNEDDVPTFGALEAKASPTRNRDCKKNY